MNSTRFRLKSTAAAVALAAGTLGTHVALAQSFDAANIQTHSLNKPAAHAWRTSPVAPIAAKPGGGAYIQWAGSQNWNGGSRGQANSQVQVTEVNAGGAAIGNDIPRGRSQPGGVGASNDGFGYHLWDGDKLTFGVYRNGQSAGSTLLMDHRDKMDAHYTPRPANFRSGVRVTRSDGSYAFHWAAPYLPFGGATAR